MQPFIYFVYHLFLFVFILHIGRSKLSNVLVSHSSGGISSRSTVFVQLDFFIYCIKFFLLKLSKFGIHLRFWWFLVGLSVISVGFHSWCLQCSFHFWSLFLGWQFLVFFPQDVFLPLTSFIVCHTYHYRLPSSKFLILWFYPWIYSNGSFRYMRFLSRLS